MQDKTEFFRTLAKTIHRAEAPLAKGSPLGSQFFDTEPSGAKPLDLDNLLSFMGGEVYNQRIAWIDALAAGGYGAIALSRPKVAGDVSEIGLGAGRSGWTPAKDIPIASAKAALLNSINTRLGKAESKAHAGLLVEQLKAICFQLLGIPCENLDADTLKSKLSAAIKTARPDLRKRLQKALGAVPDVDLNLAELLAAGAKVTKEGNVLRISA
jgi:hypothetical protein